MGQAIGQAFAALFDGMESKDKVIVVGIIAATLLILGILLVASLRGRKIEAGSKDTYLCIAKDEVNQTDAVA